LSKLDEQARAALAGGREDLAREALSRKSAISQQISDLHTQLAQLTEQEQKLTVASQQLQSKVESFRTQKETIKATYSAAEAQVRINEAFTGISNELGDVGLAIQRAEDRTAQMQARAGAMEELMATGALEVPGGKDSLTAELERMAADSSVENELAAMKAELAGASAPQAVTGGAGQVPAVEAAPAAAAAPAGEVVDAVIAEEAAPAPAADPTEPPRP
jgi:phage shock protein A